MTTQEEAERLRIALHDLAYTIFAATGIVRLTERLGMKPRQWAKDAQAPKSMKGTSVCSKQCRDRARYLRLTATSDPSG